MPTFDAETSKMPILYDKCTINGFRKADDRRTTFLDPCMFLTFTCARRNVFGVGLATKVRNVHLSKKVERRLPAFRKPSIVCFIVHLSYKEAIFVLKLEFLVFSCQMWAFLIFSLHIIHGDIRGNDMFALSRTFVVVSKET